MEKYITDEKTGLKYELAGDYYYLAGGYEPEEEHRPIGIWGQRHLQYLKRHRIATYTELLYGGKLHDYLVDINDQAEELFFQLVKQFAVQECIAEELKYRDQMLWVEKINNVRSRTTEIVNHELIYV